MINCCRLLREGGCLDVSLRENRYSLEKEQRRVLKSEMMGRASWIRGQGIIRNTQDHKTVR